MRTRDLPQAAAVIGESVWWVTIVDATLVRHHPGAYDRVLAAHAPPHRQLIEATLTGLRFVRNRIGDETNLAYFIQPAKSATDPGEASLTDWTWKPVPEPVVTSLSPRGQAWEMTRYRAYQANLADCTIGEIFRRAAAFLNRAAAEAGAITDTGEQAAR